jgi:YhcH/YjgK/YiaL family protein
MILDSLKNSGIYSGLDDRLAMAFDFLAETDFALFPDGKVELKGDEVFAIVQSYDSRLLEESKWEAHRKYIDVQFIVDGAELIGVAKTDSLTPTTEYDNDGDCVLLEGTGDMMTPSAGDFAVLYPWDAHMPGVAIDAPSPIRKVVVKIKVSN